MSRKPSFANLRTAKTAEAAAPASEAEHIRKAAEATPKEAAATPSERRPESRPESRVGRKQIAGFFTPEMSFAMHMLARRQDKSLQALMAEAFNDVLRKYGESPIGE